MMCEEEVNDHDNGGYPDHVGRLRDRVGRGGLPDHPRQVPLEQKEGQA